GCPSDNLPARVTFAVTSGTTYRIAVVTFNNVVTGGPFTLTWNLVPAGPTAPANDDFADAQTISGATGSVTATNVEAGLEGGEPDHAGATGAAGRSVWYRYTPTTSGTLTVGTCTGGDLDTVLGVYTGTTVNVLTEVADGDDDCGGEGDRARVILPVAGGTTYRIAVAGYQGDAGAFTLSWSLVASPANDAFASAQTITGLTGNVAGTTVGASTQTGEPNHASSAQSDGRSVWYSYTPTASGQLTVDTCTGTAYDSIIGVYTGTAFNALNGVANGDDECGSNARATFAVTSGTTYRIAVAGFGDGSGPFTLTWNLVPAGPTPPANDDFADAQVLTGASGTVTGSTVGATGEAGEINHAGNTRPNIRSVWYAYTPATSGLLNVDSCASTGLETTLGAYSGSAVDDVEVLASGFYECGNQARMQFAVTAGTTYHIAVARNYGEGPFTLTWGFVPPPANDAIANAQALTGTGGTISGTTVGATFEATEPTHLAGGSAANRSVWFRHVATVAGRMTLDTCDSPTRNAIGVFRGTPSNT
ncbi:hypothetical protein B7486_55440, partial [cyanobacterium TDX16]